MIKTTRFTAAILWSSCLIYLSFWVKRHDTFPLLMAYGWAFGAYIFILKKAETEADLSFYFKLSILLRGVLLFSFPNLSDDIYRFIWDGRLTNLGISPFQASPQYFIDNQLFTTVLTPDIFDHLNSKNYYSVYPTVCQTVFAFATFIFPKSILGATFIIKLFLFTCEIGSLFILKKLTQSQPKIHNSQFTIHNSQLIYALNPLVLVELSGNAHFEAAMIFFFLLAIYILSLSKPSRLTKTGMDSAALAFTWSLSIVSKMLPLLFLPLLWKYIGWKRALKVGFLTLGFLILLLLPIYNSLFFNNLAKSLNLYFNKFEFNASFYYLLRELGSWFYGYNPIQHITFLLNSIVILFILKKSLFEKPNHQSPITNHQFAIDCLFIISLYFLSATTVHPWYATLPLALASLTTLRFPIVWTLLIFTTYVGYTEGSSKHTENYFLVTAEYILTIGFFFFEFWQNRKQRHFN